MAYEKNNNIFGGSLVGGAVHRLCQTYGDRRPEQFCRCLAHGARQDRDFLRLGWQHRGQQLV